MTDYKQLNEAIETVARRIVRDATFSKIERGDTRHDLDQEFTEADWDAIEYRARELADSLEGSNEDYYAACDLLEARATEKEA